MRRAAGRISPPQAENFWAFSTILTDYTHFFNTAVTTQYTMQYTSQRASSTTTSFLPIPSNKSVSMVEQPYGQLTCFGRVRLSSHLKREREVERELR